ncbi:MAG: uncharacterized protein A8A55_1083 [Amphiamblys sp. WSBS2006]|nr:MAG: uncharacterized protein A8A55_1083 [Amphiamblys sp. WSBS2006]
MHGDETNLLQTLLTQHCPDWDQATPYEEYLLGVFGITGDNSLQTTINCIQGNKKNSGDDVDLEEVFAKVSEIDRRIDGREEEMVPVFEESDACGPVCLDKNIVDRYCNATKEFEKIHDTEIGPWLNTDKKPDRDGNTIAVLSRQIETLHSWLTF